MPLFECPPRETLAAAKDRWTPVYLEHGRLEVDHSSIKLLGADGTLCHIPVATVSALVLGPGTTVTHAAIIPHILSATAGNACRSARSCW